MGGWHPGSNYLMSAFWYYPCQKFGFYLWLLLLHSLGLYLSKFCRFMFSVCLNTCPLSFLYKHSHVLSPSFFWVLKPWWLLLSLLLLLPKLPSLTARENLLAPNRIMLLLCIKLLTTLHCLKACSQSESIWIWHHRLFRTWKLFSSPTWSPIPFFSFLWSCPWRSKCQDIDDIRCIEKNCLQRIKWKRTSRNRARELVDWSAGQTPVQKEHGREDSVGRASAQFWAGLSRASGEARTGAEVACWRHPHRQEWLSGGQGLPGLEGGSLWNWWIFSCSRWRWSVNCAHAEVSLQGGSLGAPSWHRTWDFTL